ncbi:aldehyde dehydrogenase family protein [Yinghuangia seranimata]|uniref:aldehyde dehydrogenase family protein n=1 Tax=Yinghuangia seranimata TaxID=408067 RepID=UPI00248AF8A0|nr:aldehyde dehydrogenase family protein [Yinghuangia seranimata]MDI2128197.1 aldehyde dehydrogenase family protein [Yinghuangia seranimata]
MTASVESPAAGSTARETFASLNPATGEEIARYPVHTAEEVGEAVARARVGAAWWSALSPGERKRRLGAWAGVIAREREALCRLMHEENGKPRDDAFLEVLLSLEQLTWAAGHAGRVLRRRRVSSGMAMANQAASVEYVPLGVVGVVGPWNYPMFTPMGSIGYALAAGNAVVFKPSEYTPGVGVWLADAFARANPDATSGVFEVVTGLGATGAALCASGVDKIAFTGSARTGRKVMAACAENLTPVLMECGGKDALIVADGADIKAAVDGTLWGAMANSGQTCVGIERVYVVKGLETAFLTELKSAAAKLKTGSAHPDRVYGPMTMPSQVDVVRRHVEDAVAKGATAVVGGVDSIKEPFIDPIVLVDAPEDSAAVCEETFGPTVTVRTVADVDEAVALANATPYGLAASVYAGGARRGIDIARRLRTGMVSVNAVIAYAGIPALPFGGVGESGFGRTHGADGLKEFTRAQSVTRKRFNAPLDPTTFNRSQSTMKFLDRYVATKFGRK